MQPSGANKAGTEDSFLTPHVSFLQPVVGEEAGHPGARPRAAGGAIVLTPRAEDEVPRIRVLPHGRARELHVIDGGPVRTGDPLASQGDADGARSLEKGRDILGPRGLKTRLRQKEPVPSPSDIASDSSLARYVNLDVGEVAVAHHVGYGHLVPGVKLNLDPSDWSEQMEAARYRDEAQVSKGHADPAAAVAAHPERSHVVEEDRPEGGGSVGRDEQRSYELGRSSRGVDHEPTEEVVLGAEAVPLFSDRATPQVRGARDNNPGRLALGMAVDVADPQGRRRLRWRGGRPVRWSVGR